MKVVFLFATISQKIAGIIAQSFQNLCFDPLAKHCVIQTIAQNTFFAQLCGWATMQAPTTQKGVAKSCSNKKHTFQPPTTTPKGKISQNHE